MRIDDYLFVPALVLCLSGEEQWMGLVMKKVELQAGPCIIHTVPRPHLHTRAANEGSQIFRNHGKAPSRAFSWLKAPTLAFTVKTLILRLWLWNHRKPSFAALTHIHITNTSTLLPLHLQCAVWWWKYESWTLLQDHRCSDHDQPVKQDACNLHNTRDLRVAEPFKGFLVPCRFLNDSSRRFYNHREDP